MEKISCLLTAVQGKPEWAEIQDIFTAQQQQGMTTTRWTARTHKRVIVTRKV